VKKNNKKRLIYILAMPLIWSAVFIFPGNALAKEKGVVINEVMYDPEGTDNKEKGSYEWVELKNISSEEKDISKWELRAGTYYSLSVLIKPLPSNSFVIVYEGTGANSNIDFSEGDTAYLYMNKTGSQLGDGYGDVSLYGSATHNKDTLIDYVAYGKAPSTTNATHAIDAGIWTKDDFIPDISFGRSVELKNEDNNLSSDWQESCLDGGTPGKENSQKSDCPAAEEKINPDLKIKKDDEIYKNIYANFEINYPDATNATKYTWNFGDGHKSYLQKTRHKYEGAGIYQASITIRGDKKDFQNFVIKVEEFEAPKVRIINLVPNPKGKDSKEFIVIENKSKKKINLKNWSIATGWKSPVNHPIRDDFIIKPEKSKKLTKKICAFTLNNSQSKIELRYPDGETAQKLKYNRKKDKIEDDEVFAISGKSWTWNKPQNSAEENQNDTENNQNDENPLLPASPAGGPYGEARLPTRQSGSRPDEGETINQEETTPSDDIQISKEELEASLGKYSENPAYIARKQSRVQLVGYNTKINTPVSMLGHQGHVLGVETGFKPVSTISEKHWPIRLIDDIWIKINSSLNWFLNKI
jgi:hypothetical protein